MSITITVGKGTHTIEGDGAIDTKEEAEAALTFLPENSTDTVVAGKDTFTRDQLLKIRDAGPDANAEEGGTTAADGLANGVEIQGYYAGGLGDHGHSGGGGRLSWVPSLKLAGQEHTVHIDIPVGADVGHFSTDYELPGGGEANSAFTRYGARVAPSARWVPPWAERRLSLSAGAAFGVGGLSTADSEMVSLPPSCTPGDFGQGECEPGAGPRSGPDGTKGLVNPRTGSSRGTSGAYFDVSAPIAFGVTMARGDWGNVSASAAFEPGYTYVMPSDGDGFGFVNFAGALGVRASFGGSAVEVPAATATEDKDADGVADTDDQCPSEAGPADNKGCPMEKLEGVETIGVVSAQAPDGAGQQFIVKLDPPRNGTITKAEILGKDKTYGADVDPTKLSQTGELTVTPKEKLPAGKYVFRFELEENGEKKVGQAAFEVKDIAVLDVKITPDAANAPAEKTASEVSFGVVTNKAITIAPRFVLQGQTAGLQKNYYPDPKAYEVDASQIGQATSFSFKTPDTLPAGTYTVIFDVRAEDGTTKRLSTTMTIAPKPKTVEVASLRKTGSSPYIGDRLSVWVTMEKEAPEDTSVDVVVGNAKASGVVKKGQKESEEIKVWGPGQARSAAGGGEHVIQATPKGGKTFNGPSVSVPGGGGGAPGPKGPRKPAGQ